MDWSSDMRGSKKRLLIFYSKCLCNGIGSVSMYKQIELESPSCSGLKSWGFLVRFVLKCTYEYNVFLPLLTLHTTSSTHSPNPIPISSAIPTPCCTCPHPSSLPLLQPLPATFSPSSSPTSSPIPSPFSAGSSTTKAQRQQCLPFYPLSTEKKSSTAARQELDGNSTGTRWRLYGNYGGSSASLQLVDEQRLLCSTIGKGFL